MRKPRVGYLGVGWIGRHRMEAMAATGAIEVAAICDPVPAMVAEAAATVPQAAVAGSYDALLAMRLDGIVIASPSALHAEQSIRALEAGAALFCQKPLGRDAAETQRVIDAARTADRLLGVDLSYRHAGGMVAIADLVRAGELGPVNAVDLVFHNAYGPDKPWFYDRALSGGGCVIDLGVHLVDLALWVLGFPRVADVTADLFAGGRPLAAAASEVEDHAVATIRLETGTVIRIACSWRLHAGRDAEIEARFYGPQGGAAFRNVGGSFFDFTAERYRGTQCETLSAPEQEWNGRAAADWARRLATDRTFDPAAERLADVAEVLDRIYR